MKSARQSKAVVFLDRDGTLNVEAGYLRNVSDLRLIEGAGDAIAKLNKAGVAAVLVTNQSGPARDYYPESHIVELHERLSSLLAAGGAHLDAVYYCPHLPEGSVAQYARQCDCRKPLTGMVERAFHDDPELDRERAFVVGDKATDIELARNCGARGVLVRTGYGQAVLTGRYQWPVIADFEAASIIDAVDWILSTLAAKLN
jgi:D-glycero-D-manno-heptose 1,7-bisphosphate phosphatase